MEGLQEALCSALWAKALFIKKEIHYLTIHYAMQVILPKVQTVSYWLSDVIRNPETFVAFNKNDVLLGNGKDEEPSGMIYTHSCLYTHFKISLIILTFIQHLRTGNSEGKVKRRTSGESEFHSRGCRVASPLYPACSLTSS